MEHTTMLGGNLWIWVIFIGFTIISWLISNQLKNRFQKYSKILTANGMTGRDVVEKMLRDNGISGVKIGTVEGQLTDHYNPANKTINLSKDVYYGNSIAAAAGSPRNRTCPPACQSIQHAETTFRPRPGSRICLSLGAMDSVGRHHISQHFSRITAGRYRIVRHHDPL